MEINKIYNMDALAYAQTLPDNSVHCCITSPPYYGLRNYGVDGQIGLEDTMHDYIDRLVTLFTEIKRVLHDDGTLWLNLGDSYANDSKWGGSTGGKHVKRLHGTPVGRQKRVTGLPPKSLMMIPARFAIAMQDAGWILRQEIVWAKANPMPESVKDRCTRSHEMVYMFAKSPTYYYDADAIMEPSIYAGDVVSVGSKSLSRGQASGMGRQMSGNAKAEFVIVKPYRNKRTVWNINTQALSEAHFATFPPKLIEPMILAGSPRDGIVYDPFMGSGTTALVARTLGRQYIGSELNPEYVAIAERRLNAPYTAAMF